MDSGLALSSGKAITIKGVNFNGKMAFESDNIFSTYYNISTDGTTSYGGAYPSIKTSLNLSTSNPTYEIYGAPTGSVGGAITYTKVANFTYGGISWISPRGISTDLEISSAGVVSIGNGLNVSGDVNILGNIIYSGTATFNSSFDVNGSTTFDGSSVAFSASTPVTFNGAATFNNVVTFSDGATFNTIAPTFPAGIGGNPNFTGTPTFANAISLPNGSSLAGGSISGTFTGSPTFSGTVTFSNSPTFSAGISTSNVTVTTEAYGVGWSADNTVPTKDAVYDKIESVVSSTQPLSTILTAINALAGTTGLIRKTSATTVTLDTATYLTASGVAANTYRSVTVNSSGLVTAGTNPTTLSGYGITDAMGTAGGSFSGVVTFNSTADFNNTVTFDGASVTYGATTAATFNNTTTFNGNITISGARAISGDFGNATVTSRPYFTPSVANNNMVLGIAPNGTGTNSTFAAYSSSARNAGNVFTFTQISSNESRIESGLISGSYSPILVYTGGLERFRIRTDGTVSIHAASNGSAQFNVYAAAARNIGEFRNFDDTGRGVALLNSAGTQVGAITWNASATTYATSSDYRLKNNIRKLSRDSGEFIDSLIPREWDWLSTNSIGVGFVAHEMQEICPSAVSGEKDAVDSDGNPMYQSVDPSNPEIMANIIAELQSLRKRVAELESK